MADLQALLLRAFLLLHSVLLGCPIKRWGKVWEPVELLAVLLRFIK